MQQGEKKLRKREREKTKRMKVNERLSKIDGQEGDGSIVKRRSNNLKNRGKEVEENTLVREGLKKKK